MQDRFIKTACLLAVLGALSFSAAFGQASGITTPTASRVTQPINQANRVTLKGHVLTSLTPDRDLGVVEETLPVRLYISLKRTPAQQADLDALLAAQQNTTSPMYHKWLTPEQFGGRFGASESDIDKVRGWLESQGFEITSVARNKSVINVMTTAVGVRETFHAQLHYWNIENGRHVATANDPQVPAALSDLIGSIAGLNQIPPRGHHTPIHSGRFDPATNKFYPADSAKTGDEAGATSHFTSAGGYQMTPQDFYTIYNVNPTFAAGNRGAGSTIGIIGSGPFNYGTVSGGDAGGTATGGDVATFRKLFGITTPLNLQIQHGDANFPCSGVGGTDSGESALDVEWSSAVAPAATILFNNCTDGNGFLTEVQALVDANVADTISSSLGFQEPDAIDAVQGFETAFAQAAAQGQTILSAEGDSGSDDADFGSANGTHGLNIDYPGSSTLVLSVGGTDFQDKYDVDLGSSILQSKYWSATNSQFYGSALGYVPETVWNDSCASTLSASDPDRGGSPGETPATSCDLINRPDFSGGGEGGISITFAQPSWQTGIPGLKASITKRATPDISLFSSSGTWGHALVLCDSGAGASSACTSPDTFGFAGGTSFAAPQFAGILSLLKTATGSRQGLVQPALYALAKAQYAAGTACYANGQASNTGITTGLPVASCVFNDVTTNNNNNQCDAGTTNCFTNPGASFGVFTSSGNNSIFVDAYPAGAKYDIATGLGSVNVTNLINKWNTAFTSTTSLTAAPSTITAAQSTLLTATVKGGLPPGSDDGTPPKLSGGVNFNAGAVKVGTCTLSSGSCSTSVLGSALQVGVNSITATFVGSTAYPSSTSGIVKVTVTTSGGGGGSGAPASPTFSPAGGTFTTAQSVKLSDTTADAKIYYTTNGGTPSANSTLYTNPISVTATETIQAIAIASGVSSNVVSATYTINTGGGGGGNQCTVIDYSKGFTGTALTLNGGAVLNSKVLQLTDHRVYEARSAFFTKQVPISNLTTDFTFQITTPVADGFTFIVQQAGVHSVGGAGGGLGSFGIKQSAAIKFDLYNNNGEGIDSTGMYVDGVMPTTPSTNLAPSGIDLHSGDVFAAHIAYNGKDILFTLTDTVTRKVFTQTIHTYAWDNGPGWVGFTAGTGAKTSAIKILTWTYSGGPGCGQ
jgi:Pro-kumamolisin, activation domain/Chitobiase/beta-hexosaminidase C-terminal domain/Bacterial Ig-like domain (group 3)